MGRVEFNVSCAPEARKRFNRAVAWLHSFEYEEAQKAFAEVAAADPRCAMAHRGVAMSNYHPLWAPPTAAELQRGARAVEQAKSAGAGSQRAAALAGDRKRAAAFYQRLAALCRHADADRPELAEAKAFLKSMR